MMFYSRELIDRLLDRIDILDVAQQYVGGLENRGGRWWGRCPFHEEKTPSFTLNLERKSYYCFGCQEKGNLISLVMALEHLSFPEALRKLAVKYNFPLPQQNSTQADLTFRKKCDALYKLYLQVHKAFRQNLRSERGQIARQYLQQRSVSEAMVEEFELGYATEDMRALYPWLRRQNYSAELLAESGLFSQRKPEVCLFWQRLIFPVFNTEGRVIAFSGRQLGADENIKYINSRESPVYRKGASLLGLYQSLKSLRKGRNLILCEGNLDVVAFHQAGLRNAAAPLGTAFTAAQAKLLKRYCDNVTLAFDGDAAGQKAIYKAAFILEQEGISTAVIPLAPGRDPADIFQHEGVADLKSLVASPLDFFSFLAQDLEQRFALDELTGISSALRFLAPFMTQLKEGLRRELYIAQFAKLFGLKQEVLAAETSWNYVPPKKKPLQDRPASPYVPPESSAGTSTKISAKKQKWSRPQLTHKLRAQLVEREFWASILLQADLYPEWQESLAQYHWESDDALLLKDLLDQAISDQDLNFETLCDRVSRQAPALGEWLLQKKLEPLLEGEVQNFAGYDILSYRQTILQQKYCGLQEFRLKQRREEAMEQIRRLEANNSDPALPFELLREIQGLDSKLVALQQMIQQLQYQIRYANKNESQPKLL